MFALATYLVFLSFSSPRNFFITGRPAYKSSQKLLLIGVVSVFCFLVAIVVILVVGVTRLANVR